MTFGRRIAQQSGANVTFDVVRLPWEIYYSSPLNNNTNDTAARVIYTLDELGYDCVCSAVFVYPARLQFMRYLLPHQSYGFQVVTKVPAWQPEGLFSRLFKFSRPFDWRLWISMFANIMFSGLVMTYYERNTGGDDFPLENEALKDKLMRGMFLSSMGVTLLAFLSLARTRGAYTPASRRSSVRAARACFGACFPLTRPSRSLCADVQLHCSVQRHPKQPASAGPAGD